MQPSSPQKVVYTTNPPIVETKEEQPKYRDKEVRIGVPAMPMPAAIVCCILNFLIPGFGTICAGFSSFCCSRNEDIEIGNRWLSCLIGLGIGSAQLISFVLCSVGVGWFWSCAWGVLFIAMSSEYYHNRRIAPDGGYVDRPGQNNTVIVTQQPTLVYNGQPDYPYAHSTVPPTECKQPIPQQDVVTAPPPPASYDV